MLEVLLYLPVLLYLLIYEPIFGKRDFDRLVTKVGTNPELRMKWYRSTIITLWIPSLYLVAVTYYLQESPEALGIVGFPWREIAGSALPNWVEYTSIGLAIIYLILLMVNVVMMKFSQKFRDKALQDTENFPSYMDALRPRTKQERRTWVGISFTAGICEEWLMRGFLMMFLSIYVGIDSIWLIILISSMIFGAAHYYQGIGGVIKTTLMGVFFALFYLAMGSLWLVMLLHAIVDLMILMIQMPDDQSTESETVS
jgi:membrane protease YdiL (CAAX protease family)